MLIIQVDFVDIIYDFAETRKEAIVPLIRKISCRSLAAVDACLPLIAHLFGPLCHTLQSKCIKYIIITSHSLIFYKL